MKSKFKYSIIIAGLASIIALSGCSNDGTAETTIADTTTTAIVSTEETFIASSEVKEFPYTVDEPTNTGTSDTPVTTTLPESTSDIDIQTTTTEEAGGFNTNTTETEAVTTTVQVETYAIETEPVVEKVQAPEVPMGTAIDNKYAYNTLTEREKSLYDSIYNAIINLEPTVDITTNAYTDDEWTKIFCDVYYQETELFWVEPYLIPGEIYYKSTDVAEIQNMQMEIDNAVWKIIENASSYKTEVDRVKYVHDYLIAINTFEKGGAESYSPTIYGGLVLGNPQCEGYSKAFAHVCNEMGMETVVMTGNVKSGASHAWNKIKIDGKWYNIDLTNDDPILQTPNSKHIRHTYFLIPDAWIQDISHFRFNLSQMYSSVELFEAPAATSPDYYYFNYYDSAYEDYETAYNELLNRVVNAVNNRDAVVQIRLTNYETYDKLRNSLVGLKDTAKEKTGGSWSRIAAGSDDSLYVITVSLEY